MTFVTTMSFRTVTKLYYNLRAMHSKSSMPLLQPFRFPCANQIAISAQSGRPIRQCGFLSKVDSTVHATCHRTR